MQLLFELDETQDSESYLHGLQTDRKERYMMKVQMIDVSSELNEKQIRQIEKANRLPVTYENDCPELTEDQLEELRSIKEQRREERNKKILSLRVSEKTMKKAQALGKGYTGVLSRILEEALNDPEMIKRCL